LALRGAVEASSSTGSPQPQRASPHPTAWSSAPSSGRSAAPPRHLGSDLRSQRVGITGRFRPGTDHRGGVRILVVGGRNQKPRSKPRMPGPGRGGAWARGPKRSRMLPSGAGWEGERVWTETDQEVPGPSGPRPRHRRPPRRGRGSREWRARSAGWCGRAAAAPAGPTPNPRTPPPLCQRCLQHPSDRGAEGGVGPPAGGPPCSPRRRRGRAGPGRRRSAGGGRASGHLGGGAALR